MIPPNPLGQCIPTGLLAQECRRDGGLDALAGYGSTLAAIARAMAPSTPARLPNAGAAI